MAANRGKAWPIPTWTDPQTAEVHANQGWPCSVSAFLQRERKSLHRQAMIAMRLRERATATKLP